MSHQRPFQPLLYQLKCQQASVVYQFGFSWGLGNLGNARCTLGCMREGAREKSVAVDVSATVQKAMASLPAPHRGLLEGVGAVEYQVVDEPIGEAADHFRRSAGLSGLSRAERNRLADAYGVWIKDLSVILIRGDHPRLRGLSPAAVEQFIARVVWHEVGHALSIVRCSWQDRRSARRLLERCPAGIADDIRSANYGVPSYTHEVVAEGFALLMERRQRGQGGRPEWLDPGIYDLICRVTGWTGLKRRGDTFLLRGQRRRMSSRARRRCLRARGSIPTGRALRTAPNIPSAAQASRAAQRSQPSSRHDPRCLRPLRSAAYPCAS
jgi:hypothetical protein